jgi:predicted nuclease of predicted toxin-antitoxin system
VSIRFLADADLRRSILTAAVRREPTIDFRSVIELGLPGLPDPAVLALAAEAERILVTHDAKTMPGHFGDFIATAQSPGVLIVPQHLSTLAAVDELVLIWATTDASEWINRICRLPL